MKIIWLLVKSVAQVTVALVTVERCFLCSALPTLILTFMKRDFTYVLYAQLCLASGQLLCTFMKAKSTLKAPLNSCSFHESNGYLAPSSGRQYARHSGSRHQLLGTELQTLAPNKVKVQTAFKYAGWPGDYLRLCRVLQSSSRCVPFLAPAR
jgi:hypothetical protein